MSDAEGANRRAALLNALEVRRHAKRGLVVGLGVAIVVYAVFVVLPRATVRSHWYYLALAAVLAITVGGVVTTVLVARTAVKLART